MIRAVIRSTGSYLPDRILTNADLEKMVDTSDDWIIQRTGIKRRHIAAEGQTARQETLLSKEMDCRSNTSTVPAKSGVITL